MTFLIYLLGAVLTLALFPLLFNQRYGQVWADSKAAPWSSLGVALILAALWPLTLIVCALIVYADQRRNGLR